MIVGVAVHSLRMNPTPSTGRDADSHHQVAELSAAVAELLAWRRAMTDLTPGGHASPSAMLMRVAAAMAREVADWDAREAAAEAEVEAAEQELAAAMREAGLGSGDAAPESHHYQQERLSQHRSRNEAPPHAGAMESEVRVKQEP